MLKTKKKKTESPGDQMWYQTAAGITAVILSCGIPIAAAGAIQVHQTEPMATVSEATPSEAEPKMTYAHRDIRITDGFHKDRTGNWKYYKDGQPVKNQWQQADEKWYYLNTSGRMLSNTWQQIDGQWYYFDQDGSLHNGWLLHENVWYYLTDTGMLTGYQDIPDEDGTDSFYFGEDGVLAVNTATPDGRAADADGYLQPPDGALPTFTWDTGKNTSVGSLSGMTIAGMPAEFYMLSIAGETSGGQIIMGDRGRAYGLCQFDYRYDLTEFIRYAYQKHPGLWAELSAFMNYQDGDEMLVGNTELRDAFAAATARSYEASITDQLEFMRAHYWDGFARAMDAAGYQMSKRHVAVQAAFFSVNVNCGVQTELYQSNITPDATDAEMICQLYTLRNTVLAEQNVGRTKKGTTMRYRLYEPQMALDLLHGYTTIDSSKSYGGGVSWHGNIFAGGIISTTQIEGSSAEWAERQMAQEELETAEPATASEAEERESEEYSADTENRKEEMQDETEEPTTKEE